MCHHISYTWCFFRILRIPLNLEPELELGSVNKWNGTTVRKLSTLWNMAVGGNWSTSMRRPSLPLWGIPSITSVTPPSDEHKQKGVLYIVTIKPQVGLPFCVVHSAIAIWHVYRTCGKVVLTFTGSQKHLLKEAHHTLSPLTPIPLQSKLLIKEVVKDLRTDEELCQLLLPLSRELKGPTLLIAPCQPLPLC